jgi:hypothetical protein
LNLPVLRHDSAKNIKHQEKCQYPNITSQKISAEIMADSFSLHRSFSKGHQPSVTTMEMLAEDSDTSMGLPPKKHAFGPLVPLSHESEQIDSVT